MYDPKKGVTKVIADIPVFFEQEYGVMGINIDPKFNQNKWVYLYYSMPRGGTDTTQHLSRFVYDDVNDLLILNSEKNYHAYSSKTYRLLSYGRLD